MGNKHLQCQCLTQCTFLLPTTPQRSRSSRLLPNLKLFTPPLPFTIAMAAHTVAAGAWTWEKVDVAGKKICCIGAGYVGGTTMAIIAEKVPDVTVSKLGGCVGGSTPVRHAGLPFHPALTGDCRGHCQAPH